MFRTFDQHVTHVSPLDLWIASICCSKVTPCWAKREVAAMEAVWPSHVTFSGLRVSSSPIFLPITVSSSPAPKISVRRSASCFRLLPIDIPVIQQLQQQQKLFSQSFLNKLNLTSSRANYSRTSNKRPTKCPLVIRWPQSSKGLWRHGCRHHFIGNVIWRRESARKGLNSNSGAQFVVLPLVKPVVWFARTVVNWRSRSVAKSA